MKKRFDRGVTIVEAVVAMTVITIVSITAVSIVRQGIEFSNRAEYSAAARRDASNALESFKLADDISAFGSLIPYANLASGPESGDSGTYIYEYGIIYRTVITVEYGENETDRDVFEAICTDKHGDEVFSLSYEKG